MGVCLSSIRSVGSLQMSTDVREVIIGNLFEAGKTVNLLGQASRSVITAQTPITFDITHITTTSTRREVNKTALLSGPLKGQGPTGGLVATITPGRCWLRYYSYLGPGLIRAKSTAGIPRVPSSLTNLAAAGSCSPCF